MDKASCKVMLIMVHHHCQDLENIYLALGHLLHSPINHCCCQGRNYAGSMEEVESPQSTNLPDQFDASSPKATSNELELSVGPEVLWGQYSDGLGHTRTNEGNLNAAPASKDVCQVQAWRSGASRKPSGVFRRASGTTQHTSMQAIRQQDVEEGGTSSALQRGRDGTELVMQLKDNSSNSRLCAGSNKSDWPRTSASYGGGMDSGLSVVNGDNKDTSVIFEQLATADLPGGPHSPTSTPGALDSSKDGGTQFHGPELDESSQAGRFRRYMAVWPPSPPATALDGNVASTDGKNQQLAVHGAQGPKHQPNITAGPDLPPILE